MAVNLSPVGGVAAQFFDNSGNVLTGGLLYTYAAGTTTPAVTYTASDGITPQPNPIVLDAAGRVPNSGEIWLTDGVSYKFVLQDQYAVQIATWDNIIGINSNFLAYALQAEVQTATQGQTIFTLADINYQPATNSLAVFVNGSRQIVTLNYIETSSTVVTFVDGLNVDDVVEFITAISTATNAISAANVGYNEGDTGAVDRSVESKLQETVSVKDFGAVGDGTTDDTAAIQAAVTACNGKILTFPEGTYKTTSTITTPSNCTIDLGIATLKPVGTIRAFTSTPIAAGVSTTVSSGATQGATQVVVASAIGISIGQYFKLTATSAYNFPTVWGKVTNISGSTISLDQALPTTYAGTINFYTYGALYESFTLQNGIIDGSLNTWNDYGVVRPNNYINATIEGVTFTGFVGTAAAWIAFIYEGFNGYICGCNYVNSNCTGEVYQIQDVSNAVISNNTINGGGFGASIVRAVNAKYIGNTFTGRNFQEVAGGGTQYSTRGIKPIGNGYLEIIGNNVSNYNTGVKYEDTFRHSTVGNSIFNCYAGGLNQSGPTGDVTYSGFDVFQGNVIENCGYDLEPAFFVTTGPGMVLIEGNTVRNARAAGIYVSTGKAVIQNNIVTNWGLDATTWAGIYLFGTDPSGIVSNNTFNNSVSTTPPCLYTAATSTGKINFQNNFCYTTNPLYASTTVVGPASVSFDSNSGTVLYGIKNNSFSEIGSANNYFNGSLSGFYRSGTETCVNQVGAYGNFLLSTGKTVTFTCSSIKLFSVSIGSGKAALLFADYTSATIATISDPSSLINLSASPPSGYLGVYKSANSQTISIVSNIGSDALVVINALGAVVSATTDPV